ncbi:MAG: DegV family EDD domain-containing protein [Clostridiales bacterium]|nr:DegV family EDD domain-containing protein [Clostridiales bacterium]
MSFAIIPDTACDLDKKLRDRFGIEDYMRGTIYYPDGHSELISLDWEKMTPDEYYSSMKGHNALYKTASVPMGEIKEVFEKHLNKGEDILSISLSSGLSTSFNETELVAKELREKYPERKILCVDSLRYSTALALLVIKGCEKRNEGASIEETYEYLNDLKWSIHQMGFMDDLYFLAKTGRVSNFKAFFGTLVGVAPLADFNKKGVSEVLAKAKGRKQAVKATVEYMKKFIINPEDQIIFVAHSLRKEFADMLAEDIKETFHPKEIIMNDVGMACGASIGPGLCSAYFIGKPMSDNCEEEKAALNEIVANLKK